MGLILNGAKNTELVVSLAHRKLQAPKNRLYAILPGIVNFSTEKLQSQNFELHSVKYLCNLEQGNASLYASRS